MEGRKKKSNNEAKSFWIYLERASLWLVFWFILHGSPIDPILEYVPAYVIHYLFSIPWIFIVWYGLKACQLIHLKIIKNQISQRQIKTNNCIPNSDNIINIDTPHNTVDGSLIGYYGTTYKPEHRDINKHTDDWWEINKQDRRRIQSMIDYHTNLSRKEDNGVNRINGGNGVNGINGVN